MSSVPVEQDWAGACEVPGRISGRCVGHRIVINAPRAVVWDFIGDFEGWAAWNPLYIQTRGRAEAGKVVQFTVAVPGLRLQKGKAQVYTVQPAALLEYGLSNLGGMIKAFRFIEIEELSPTSCSVANGEIMGGPLGLLIVRSVGPKVAQGLEAMNEALKVVAERKWESRPA